MQPESPIYWSIQIDGYCERTDFAFWSEPVNALTNLAFIAAAMFMWPRVRGQAAGQVLVLILFAIGIGSGLFHTLATRWAALADTLPIAVFVLTYIYLATKDFLGLSWLWSSLAVVATIAFLPLAAFAMSTLPLIGVSAGYLPIPLLIFGYALALRARHPATARNLAIGGGILALSILLRSVDQPLCARLPIGTHFAWHILNAIMLGWMIETWVRHRLASPQRPR